MTLRHSDTAEIVAAAKAAGVLLAEGMWTRFFPCVVKAREVIAAGGIGEVLQVGRRTGSPGLRTFVGLSLCGHSAVDSVSVVRLFAERKRGHKSAS